MKPKKIELINIRMVIAISKILELTIQIKILQKQQLGVNRKRLLLE